jgi:hypothetical protein
MNSKVLDLENLIRGFRLSCQTEGKSPKTIEWYTSCFIGCAAATNRSVLFVILLLLAFVTTEEDVAPLVPMEGGT